MVAYQLKSLTLARLSLIPFFSMPSNTTTLTSSSASSSVFDCYASTFAEFTTQYIDALGSTGNLPITRKDWLDVEVNLALSEWMERERKRQFGVCPRKVDIMDWSNCLEKVYV